MDSGFNMLGSFLGQGRTTQGFQMTQDSIALQPSTWKPHIKDHGPFFTCQEEIDRMFNEWMWDSGNHEPPLDIEDKQQTPVMIAKQFKEWAASYQSGSEMIGTAPGPGQEVT